MIHFGSYFFFTWLAVLGYEKIAEARIPVEKEMVVLPKGEYTPFETDSKKENSEKETKKNRDVDSFLLDAKLVTNEKFLQFVKNNSFWRKSKIKKIFADSHYLESWPSDLNLGTLKKQSPVVHVSWFAASAYCEAQGKALPTTDQWEYALADGGSQRSEIDKKILEWYSRPTKTETHIVGKTKNKFGVYDIGLMVWEWTQDFNSFLGVTDSRDNSGKESNLFCGGSSQMGNPSDYASFMRYSFRSSLKANYTTSNLGFRCAKEISQ